MERLPRVAQRALRPGEQQRSAPSRTGRAAASPGPCSCAADMALVMLSLIVKPAIEIDMNMAPRRLLESGKGRCPGRISPHVPSGRPNSNAKSMGHSRIAAMARAAGAAGCLRRSQLFGRGQDLGAAAFLAGDRPQAVEAAVCHAPCRRPGRSRRQAHRRRRRRRRCASRCPRKSSRQYPVDRAGRGAGQRDLGRAGIGRAVEVGSVDGVGCRRSIAPKPARSCTVQAMPIREASSWIPRKRRGHRADARHIAGRGRRVNCLAKRSSRGDSRPSIRRSGRPGLEAPAAALTGETRCLRARATAPMSGQPAGGCPMVVADHLAGVRTSVPLPSLPAIVQSPSRVPSSITL